MKIAQLNSVKTSIFRFFTGSFRNTCNPAGLDCESAVRILITRPNHRLGNQLLLSPLIQELEQKFPNARIDLVVNGNLSLVLFSEFASVRNIFNLPKKPFKNLFKYVGLAIRMMINRYDLAIAANERSNSSKIFVRLSRSRNKIYNSGENISGKPRHFGKIPVYDLLKFLEPSADLTNYEYPALSVKLTPEEIGKGHEKLCGLFPNSNPTLCLYTYATGRKCHSREWWSAFYSSLKVECCNYNLLEILPLENLSQIDFESVHIYSTDLREIASIIENCSIFIGADSGMMHLSAATGTTTLGLFNVTDPEVYTPYGNQNGWINTTNTGIEKIISRIKVLAEQDHKCQSEILAFEKIR